MRILKVPPTSPSIYVIDDAPFLTELYCTVLEASGYAVRAFSDRAEAIAALKADLNKPVLLVTDYRGLSMPVDRFLHECLMVHPALRILMVSGFRRVDVRFSQARPDRFMEKPFTLQEFQREVEAVLAA
jgi:DNA-binding NtrC family response regulator